MGYRKLLHISRAEWASRADQSIEEKILVDGALPRRLTVFLSTLAEADNFSAQALH
jgi:hypothetical protein